MKNDKGLTIERDNRTVTYTQERLLENPALTGRTNINININNINKRNAEQEKQEKKSSYTVAEIIVLLIVLIIVAIYFLS